MYDAFDLGLTRQKQDDTNARVFEGIEDLEFTDVLKLFRNDFDLLCTSAYPEITTAKALLTESKAAHVMLSGSGSCIFGIYENEVLQKEAYSWLKKQCKKYSYSIWLIKTVGITNTQNPKLE
jgi:4-diphosphocytidyl-2C-methyl-D-erythritol kinase